MKDIYLIVTFFITFFVSMTERVQAQILNIEQFRLRADTANVWLGNLSLGFTANQQKNDVLNLNAEGDLAYLSENHSYKLLSQINVIKVEEQNAISEGYVHLRFNMFRRRTVSLEQFSQLQYDVGRGLQRRTLTGAVGRVSILSNERAELSVNGGAMYEWEIWEDEGLNEEIENKFLKISTNFTFRVKFSESLGLVSSTYYQARPVSFFKPRITTDSQLVVRASEHFSFGLSYAATYDAEPVVDIADYISEISTNFNISF